MSQKLHPMAYFIKFCNTPLVTGIFAKKKSTTTYGRALKDYLTVAY